MTFRISAFTIFLIACGGGASATPPASPTVSPSASTANTPSPEIPDASAPASASIVRYDDLGVSFAVPADYKVLGDDALAARIRASANPRLTAALQNRASQKKAIPLLTLSKDTDIANEGLTITFTVASVPLDATAMELVTKQQSVMKENLADFAITDGPKNQPQDAVDGVELSDRYTLPSKSDPKHMASLMRVYVRKGLAFAIVAAWSAASTDRAAEAKALLDGLHFYDPAG